MASEKEKFCVHIGKIFALRHERLQHFLLLPSCYIRTVMMMRSPFDSYFNIINLGHATWRSGLRKICKPNTSKKIAQTSDPE